MAARPPKVASAGRASQCPGERRPVSKAKPIEVAPGKPRVPSFCEAEIPVGIVVEPGLEVGATSVPRKLIQPGMLFQIDHQVYLITRRACDGKHFDIAWEAHGEKWKMKDYFWNPSVVARAIYRGTAPLESKVS